MCLRVAREAPSPLQFEIIVDSPFRRLNCACDGRHSSSTNIACTAEHPTASLCCGGVPVSTDNLRVERYDVAIYQQLDSAAVADNLEAQL
jgi:hypothetical protein